MVAITQSVDSVVKRIVAFFCLLWCSHAVPVLGDPGVVGNEAGDIGIEEKLGEYVPLDLRFVDTHGDSVTLRDLIDRPTILTLVYYHCPTICKPLLTNVADVVKKTDLRPGEDYNLLTVSFDEYDTPETAAAMRSNIVSAVPDLDATGWRFLTGDLATISRLTASVGFNVRRRGDKDFAHGASLIVLSPDGKIVRYLYGLSYLPFDLKMAVTEAKEGTVVPTLVRVLKFCFSYDPEGQRYVFNATRIVGAGMLLFAFGWIGIITILGRKGPRKSRRRHG